MFMPRGMTSNKVAYILVMVLQLTGNDLSTHLPLVPHILGTIFNEVLIQNNFYFIHGNASENIVGKMAAILSMAGDELNY